MPLYSDRRRQANSTAIMKELSYKIHYTGYVCDESMPLHKRKNNIIYVSTGLNKEEGYYYLSIYYKLLKNKKLYFYYDSC